MILRSSSTAARNFSQPIELHEKLHPRFHPLLAFAVAVKNPNHGNCEIEHLFDGQKFAVDLAPELERCPFRRRREHGIRVAQRHPQSASGRESQDHETTNAE